MKNLFTNSCTRWLGIVICTCMLLLGNAHAWGESLAITVSEPTSAGPHTDNGVTIKSNTVASNKTFNGSSNQKVFKVSNSNDTLGIRSTSANITKIYIDACAATTTANTPCIDVYTSSDGSTYSCKTSGITISGGATGTNTASGQNITLAANTGHSTVTLTFSSPQRYIKLQRATGSNNKESSIKTISVYTESISEYRTFKSGEKLYFKDAVLNNTLTGSTKTWKIVGGDIFAYFYDASGNDAWANVDGLAEGTQDADAAVYRFIVPQLSGVNHEWTTVIFTRAAQGTPWGFDQGGFWNKTGDQRATVGKNMFKIKDEQWDNKWNGSWDLFAPADAPAIVGTFNSWNPDASGYTFTEFSDNVGKVYITLDAETTYNFKIVQGSSQYSCTNYTITGTTTTHQVLNTGNQDCKITTTEAGEYVIKYDKNYHKITAAYYPNERLPKNSVLYFDARNSTTWTSASFASQYIFKYYDSGSEQSTTKCLASAVVEEAVYHASVPDNKYIGGVEIHRWSADGNTDWNDHSNTCQPNTRSTIKDNCMYITVAQKDWWTTQTLQWKTYCPPMSSASLSDNSTSMVSWQTGDGTSSSTPYLVEASGTIKVIASATSAVTDANMTPKFDFKVNDNNGGASSAQSGNEYTYDKGSLTANHKYEIGLDTWNNYNNTDGTKNTSASHLWYKAVTLRDVEHTLSHVTCTGGRAAGTGQAADGEAFSTTFTADPGYNLPSDVTVKFGDTKKTKNTDYTWNSSTGVLVINAASYGATIKITVTGEAKTTTIKLDDNDENHGASGDGTASVNYDATAVTSITHTEPATGYQLKGYYTAKIDGYKVLNADGTFATYSSNISSYISSSNKWCNESENVTLYAQYEDESYSVTHAFTNASRSSGGTDGASAATHGTDYSVTVAASSGYTLPENITVTIGGNSTTAGTEYTWSSNTVTIGGSYITGDIVITIDGIVKKSVTYKKNGGASGADGEVTGATTDDSSPYAHGSTVTTISNNFINSGHKFKWWNTNYGGDGEDFYVGEQFTITANTNLYAQWEEVDSDEEFWCGIPDEWHATTHDVTVGDMNVTAKDYSSSNNYINKAVGKYKDYTVVNATDKHATVMAVAGDDYYIEISFTDGSTINELNLGVTTSETTAQNIVVCYSTTADFRTGQYEFVKVGSTDNVVSVPGHDQSTKSVTNVSPSTENKYKYVRIYRKLTDGTDYNSTGVALGSSAKARIYSIKAKKGSAGYALTNAGPDNGAIAITSDGSSAITESEAGETVYITATPSTGYSFSAWDIYKTDASGTKVTPAASTASTSFTMPSYAVTVNATFAAINYAITHNAAENGTYTISVAGGAATDENTTANYGQTITLAATPSSHYKLQAWNVTKTSSGDEITVTDNEFTMPAEDVTIAPTFGRVYTVSFNTHGGSSQASIEQSSVGGAITMPAAPTKVGGYEFVNWMIGGTTVAAGAEYTPTEDVTAHATWRKECEGGGGSEPVVLFSQNFNSATTSSAVYTATTLNSESSHNLFGSTASSQFTSFGMASKNNVGYASNTSVTVNSTSYNYTGKFGVRAANTEGTYSLMKTTDFAATAPTAIKVEMKMKFLQGSSGSDYSLSFAVGDGFTDGTKPAATLVHSGFSILNNSNADICGYLTNSAITGQTKLSQSDAVITWVINNTGSSLTYTGPDDNSHTLADDKFDVWQGTSLHATGTASTPSKDLQELYIGDPKGKNHEFYLDSIVVTNLNASSCYYVTYDGNGADAGYVYDDHVYTDDDAHNDPMVQSNYLGFEREGYEFNGWYTKANYDGSGTAYEPYDFISDINDDITLYAQWKIVVDEDNENLSGFETPQYKDVAVRNGATLTITEDMSVRNITVESGSTLHVAKNGEEGVTFATKSLSLKGGYYQKPAPDYSEVYDMPRVYIDPLSTLTRTNSTINFDIAVTNQYHPIAVPFPVKVSDVNYVKETLALIAEYGKHYDIRTYDGADRANYGAVTSNWTHLYTTEWNTETEKFDDIYLKPGRGYILAAMRGAGDLFSVIRFPMKNVSNDWTTLGEQGTVDEVTKNVVEVEAYLKDGDTDGSKTPNANKGWNILGVPFMSRYQATDDIIQSSTEIIQGHFDYSTNKWVDDEIRYVTVPTYDFSEYNQYSIEDDGTILLPGWCFFVQVETSGNLKFLSASEAEDEAMPIYAPKREQERKPTVKTGIILTGANAKDKTTILVSDKYSAAEYEINADLEKMFGENGYTLATYTLSGETRLAYNAMNNADIMNVIPVGYRAPEEGEYTFSINPRYAESEAFEQVNLIDYEEGVITNLLQSSYSFTTARTQNDARFAINVVKRQYMPTDIENDASGINDANGPRKVLINEKMYILLDGKMYDATGKAVK